LERLIRPAGCVQLRIVLAALLLAAVLPASAFDLQAHRGGRALLPENTLPAFEHALTLGVSTLETDLALTSDGVLVLSHDPRLNPALTRGPDGRWIAAPGPAIRSLTRAELADYDVGRIDPASEYARQWPAQRAVDGTRIPTLAALFALGRGNAVRFNIETKLTPDGADAPAPDEFARAVVAAVRAAGLSDRVTVQSFDWRTLVAVRALAPEIATACLTIETPRMDTVRPGVDGASPWHAGLRAAEHGGSPVALARAAGCGTWSPYFRNVDAARVAEAHALGLKVLPWTVNDPAEMRRLVHLGVDGLITDAPDVARTTLQSLGVRID
jgi:glycerophosphoryl diester phosphodiesterase